MDNRRFTAPTDEIEGTVETATPGGITLKEHPGQVLQFSSVGMSAADMSASILGEHNNLTRTEVAGQVDERRQNLMDYLAGTVGSKARLTIPEGSADRATQIRAVINIDGKNLNRELIDQGYGQYQEHLGGAEAQEMFGAAGKAVGSIAEALSFQGDSTSVLNPMRYIPTPGHTKAWQERTPLDQYLSNEVIGTRMRRWERPIHDFLTRSFRPVSQKTSRTGAGKAGHAHRTHAAPPTGAAPPVIHSAPKLSFWLLIPAACFSETCFFPALERAEFGNLAWPTSAVCFGPPFGTLMLRELGSAGA
jgi:hypothetical protein